MLTGKHQELVGAQAWCSGLGLDVSQGLGAAGLATSPSCSWEVAEPLGYEASRRKLGHWGHNFEETIGTVSFLALLCSCHEVSSFV